MVDIDAQHTNYNGNEKTLSTSNVSRLQLKWTVPNNTGTVFQVVVVGKTLYAYDFQSISALDATTGTQKWTTQIGVSNLNFPTPLVTHGYVYAYGSDANASTLQLTALNASTGKIVWSTVLSHSGPSSNSGLTYANGVVYAGGSESDKDGLTYAVNAKTGQLLRAFDTGSNTGSSGPIWSAPSVANGILYVRTLYTIQAFNISTGAHLWTVKHGGKPSSDSGVTISNNLAIYSESMIQYSEGKQRSYTKLYALDAKTGAQKWAVRGTAGAFGTNIAVAKGVVYAKGSDVTAYNETTGKMIWTVAASPSSSPSQGIAVANGVVFSVQWNNSGASALLLAFNATTGKKLWSYTYNQGFLFCPIVANGMVYIGNGRNLLAFALS